MNGTEPWVSAPQATDRLAIALDFPSARTALDCVDRLDGSCRWIKVGLELYTAAGNSLLETLRRRGLNVFLDLKLHDIPNTVAGAVRSVAELGASLLTIHAGGGEAMMRAAVEASNGILNSPRLLAVTVLTSMDQQQMEGVGLLAEPAIHVLRLARLAERCGLRGLVCSPQETALLRHEMGEDMMLVVPGIRSVDAATGDQRRVATATRAIQSGASMLVVGRPITQSPDPARAARVMLAEIAAALPPG